MGEVVYHDLSKTGTITYYDMRFGNRIIRGIPARLIESGGDQPHEHEARD